MPTDSAAWSGAARQRVATTARGAAVLFNGSFEMCYEGARPSTRELRPPNVFTFKAFWSVENTLVS